MFDILNYIANTAGIPMWMVYTVIASGAYATYLSYSNENKKGDKIATSGFAKSHELSDFNGKDGIQLSRNFSLSEKYCFEHIAVIGPTGAGKTTSIFYPNLLQKDSFSGGKSSIIITDPKGELYRDTADFQSEIGRKVKLFSPLEPQYSFKYNPLDFCMNESEVIDLAGNLLASGGKAIEIQSGKTGGSSEWINMAKPLWASALLYIWYKPRGLNTIYNALDLILDASPEQLEKILGNSKYDSVRRQFNAFNQASGSERTVSSIKVTLSTNLQLFTDPQIRELTSRNTFDFAEMRKTPIAIYISYPERHAARIAPLLSIFFAQAINSLMEERNLIKNYLPTYFLFDEFANIGQIPNFATLASTVRSRKISFLCCLQSKNQLKTVYGNFDETILANLKTKAVYGALQDLDTTAYISKLCGEVEVTTKSKSVSGKEENRYSYNYSTSKKMLLTADEVMRINKKNILLLVQNNKPYLDQTNIFYTQNKYIVNVRKKDKCIS
ncbi:VirD4-like conjugal transfer protein, CD1115 family [Clostridium perfringens]|jgi:type IV secretion system protein VirD4|nr:type IV secretory system conjugative DNA transfer family protein [Clostridium perfringens]